MIAPPRNRLWIFTGLILSLGSSYAIACDPSQPLEFETVGCEPSDPGSTGPAFDGDSKIRSYAEIRGTSGAGALVLQDGTQVAFDFAAGNTTITRPGAATLVVHVSQLIAEEQANFWRLAGAIANDPNFSLESGHGNAPSPGNPPVLAGRRPYPLRWDDFRFPGSRLKSSDDKDDESPCRESSRCRPPQTLPTIIVTTTLPSGGSGAFVGGGGWIRLVNPPTPVSTCPGDPTMCDWIDRENWRRWRQDRCDAVPGALVALTTAGIAVATTCFTPVVATGLGTAACAGSAVGYAWALYESGRATKDCTSSYGGPGTW